MSRRGIFLLVLGAVLVLPHHGRAAEPIVLKLACPFNENAPGGVALQKVKALLENRFKDRVDLSFHPRSQLGDSLKVIKRMQAGEPIINAPGSLYLGNVEPSFLLFDLPFAFSSLEHARKVLEGPIGKEISTRFLAKGFRVLAFWDLGFATIGTRDRALRSFEDLKGLRLRVPESQVVLDAFKTLGIRPAHYPLKDAKKALVEFKMDGLSSAGLSLNYEEQFYELLKFIYVGKIYYIASTVCVSEALWQKLPADIRTGVAKAFEEVTPWEWARARQNEAVYEQKLKKLGVEIVKFSPAEEERVRRQLMDVWRRYESVIGKELVEQLERSY